MILIIPASPPFPHDVELPPFATTAVPEDTPSELYTMTVPPFPPSVVPFAPFAVIVPVVEVDTVTVPPFAPLDVALTTIALVVAF